jgi:hypothetical protein
MHATHSLFQATDWPMNPCKKIFGKSLSSSSIMEGTNRMRKNLDKRNPYNIWQQNFGCYDKASWFTRPSDFWLLPTPSISLGFMTPMAIINLPQIFYSCLILDSPFSIHAQIFVHFRDLQLPCKLFLAPLAPLIPSLHMLLDSHMDSWFISAS